MKWKKLLLPEPGRTCVFSNSCQQNTAALERWEIHRILPEPVCSKACWYTLSNLRCLTTVCFSFHFLMFMAWGNDGILMSQSDAKGWWCPKMYNVDWSVVMETEPFSLTKILPGSTFSLTKKTPAPCEHSFSLPSFVSGLFCAEFSMIFLSLWSTFFLGGL